MTKLVLWWVKMGSQVCGLYKAKRIIMEQRHQIGSSDPLEKGKGEQVIGGLIFGTPIVLNDIHP